MNEPVTSPHPADPGFLDPAELAIGHLHAAVRMHQDTGAPDVLRRTALTEGVGVIDSLLRELHQLREAMVREARRSDDETDARVDRMLRELGAGR